MAEKNSKLRRAFVMVHPFDDALYEAQPDYIEERDAILRSESDLYVLTCDVPHTREALGGRKAGVISTEQACNPKPKMGWRLLSKTFEGYDELIFCGAELHLGADGRPYTGCVLDAFEKVSHPNKWIYLAACWAGE